VVGLLSHICNRAFVSGALGARHRENIPKRHICTHHRPHLPHFTTHYRNCVCTARNAVFLDSLSRANIVAKRFVFAPQQWRFSQLDDVICRLTRPQRQRPHIHPTPERTGWLAGWPPARLPPPRRPRPLPTAHQGTRPCSVAPAPRGAGTARGTAGSSPSEGGRAGKQEQGARLQPAWDTPAAVTSACGRVEEGWAGTGPSIPPGVVRPGRCGARRVGRSRKPDRVRVERLPAAHACRRGLQPAACLALARHPAPRDAMLHAAARGWMEEAARRHEHTRVCSCGWGKLRPTHWSHAGATKRTHVTQPGAMRCSIKLRGAACRKLRAARCPVLSAPPCCNKVVQT